MAILSVELDISQLISTHENLAEQIEAKTQEYVRKLATQAHAHILQQIKDKMKNSSLQVEFGKSLSLQPVDDHTWSVIVPQKMVWIEDGLPSGFDMLPGLLKSPKAKSGKNGKYIIIPFKHNKIPQQQSAFEQIVNKYVKDEMKSRNVPYGKIEKNPDGSPKLGTLHKFNVNTPSHSHAVKPGQSGPQRTPSSCSSTPTGP